MMVFWGRAAASVWWWGTVAFTVPFAEAFTLELGVAVNVDVVELEICLEEAVAVALALALTLGEFDGRIE